MALYDGKPFPDKKPGECSACSHPLWRPARDFLYKEGPIEREWAPGTVRLRFDHTGEEPAFREGYVELTFCPDCAEKVDESDMFHIEDLIWRGWKAAWEAIGLTGKILEGAVHQRRGFKLIGINDLAVFMRDDGQWQDISWGEIRERARIKDP